MLIESSFGEHAERLDELFSVLSDEEKEAFGSLMRKVGNRAENREV
jgi:hypothetical protein